MALLKLQNCTHSAVRHKSRWPCALGQVHAMTTRHGVCTPLTHFHPFSHVLPACWHWHAAVVHMGSGSSSGRPDAGWLVGSGVSGADGVLGRCLAYSLQLDWYSADTQSEWVDMHSAMVSCTLHAHSAAGAATWPDRGLTCSSRSHPGWVRLHLPQLCLDLECQASTLVKESYLARCDNPNMYFWEKVGWGPQWLGPPSYIACMLLSFGDLSRVLAPE
jgi:hypothetical protein